MLAYARACDWKTGGCAASGAFEACAGDGVCKAWSLLPSTADA